MALKSPAKTIRQVTREAKNEAKKLFASVKLPKVWIALFVHVNREYFGQEMYIYNVKKGVACPTNGLMIDLRKWIKKNDYYLKVI